MHLTIRREKIEHRAQLAEDTLVFWEFKEVYPKLKVFERRAAARAAARQRRNMKAAARLSSGESVWVRLDYGYVASKFYHTPSDSPLIPLGIAGAHPLLYPPYRGRSMTDAATTDRLAVADAVAEHRHQCPKCRETFECPRLVECETELFRSLRADQCTGHWVIVLDRVCAECFKPGRLIPWPPRNPRIRLKPKHWSDNCGSENPAARQVSG